MAGSEDTELHDLVVEALEKNGSLAKVRALLRANIFLAFENEREPKFYNPALDRLIDSAEGTLALAIVAEFLDFCHLNNTAYVYKAESRQGRAYHYDGRDDLPECVTKEYAVKEEPVLLTILRQSVSNYKKTHLKSPSKDKKDDENCTYIVHDESGSTRSHSDNSYDKNKLMLRLPLDNSDTDSSSDSMQEKTSSEYIPNKNIHLDPDSDEESKLLHYVLSPKSYMEESQTKYDSERKMYEPYVTIQNATIAVDDHGIVNTSDSMSYLDNKPNTVLNIANGVETVTHTSVIVPPSLPDISENIESGRSSLKQDDLLLRLDSNGNSMSAEKTSENQSNSKVIDNKSDKSFNYSDDFSPLQESSRSHDKKSHISPRSAESESIQEEINMNGSDPPLSSPLRRSGSARSSVSISDITELIEDSAINSPTYRNKHRHQQTSVIVRNSNLDEVAHKLTQLLRYEDDKRLTKTSEEVSETQVRPVKSIRIDVHSD